MKRMMKRMNPQQLAECFCQGLVTKLSLAEAPDNLCRTSQRIPKGGTKNWQNSKPFGICCNLSEFPSTSGISVAFQNVSPLKKYQFYHFYLFTLISIPDQPRKGVNLLKSSRLCVYRTKMSKTKQKTCFQILWDSFRRNKRIQYTGTYQVGEENLWAFDIGQAGKQNS